MPKYSLKEQQQIWVKLYRNGSIDMDQMLHELGFGTETKLSRRHFDALHEVEQATLTEVCTALEIELPEDGEEDE